MATGSREAPRPAWGHFVSPATRGARQQFADSFALPLGLTHVETWASPRARPCREIQESSPAVANFLSVELPP